MNAPHGLSADADNLNLMKFGIGQPVPRQEDPTLLKGQGRYTDDMNLPNQAYAVMVRSQVAHGVLKGIDAEEAKKMPGVLGVWSGADLNAAGYGPLKTLIPVANRDGSPMKTPVRSPPTRCASSAIRWPSSSPRPWRRPRTRPKQSCSTSTPCRR
jgi:carbon-monoxide dehydrogenase large subunit